MAEKQRVYRCRAPGGAASQGLRAKPHGGRAAGGDVRSYLVLAPRRSESLAAFLRTWSVGVGRRASSRSPKKRR